MRGDRGEIVGEGSPQPEDWAEGAFPGSAPMGLGQVPLLPQIFYGIAIACSGSDVVPDGFVCSTW